MIIKSIRGRTKLGIGKLINHVLYGEENERVEILHGTEADIRDMHLDAKSNESTYSVRHWIISPHATTTRQQLLILIKHLATEFGFDARRSVIVEHKKSRVTTDATDTHWHVIVGETDPVSGRILRSSFDHILHELVARLSEHKFGHPFVLGKHSKAVVAGLKQRGFHDAAEQMASIIAKDSSIPQAAFTHCQHQEKKRKGIDLPAARAKVRSAFHSSQTFCELAETLATDHLFLKEGDKPGTWIVANGHNELVGALHRLAGVRKSEVDILKNRNGSFVIEERTVRDTSHYSDARTASTAYTLPNLEIEKMLRHLGDIEEFAVSEINSQPPPKPKVDKNYLRQELSDAMDELAKATERQAALTEMLFCASPKWWWRLTGKLARWNLEKPRLQTELAEKDKKVVQASTKVNRIVLQQRAAESLRDRLYKADIQKRQDHERAAKRRLSIVEAARDIIARTPNIAQFGITQLLMQAERHVDRGHSMDESPKIRTQFTKRIH